ncbi:M20/M25/M40 family metallo-hydrolase [Anthocerotibacter panamensis]|uniref:M20/M25/M40 family metallo-hydrolase n=1 Tax=Anthocerotibacter panamensis TaxID=2857077 RepID=UPI001C403BAE|nr:M28 family metallopeptidase [Anthocerotibacter panamensis]
MRVFAPLVMALALLSPLATEAQSAAPARDPQIEAVVAQVSGVNIEATIRKLVSFGTRHTLSDTTSPTRGIGAARAWVQSQFERYRAASGGRLQVMLDRFLQEKAERVPRPTELVNVLAVLPGTTDPERIYIVSGHLDSCVCNQDILDATSDAPGANDDASGVAAVLELARVMSQMKFDATLVFAAVVGEEQGLLGAAHLAQEYRKKNANVAAMITNDIIGSSVGGNGVRDNRTVRLFSEGVPTNEAESEVRVRRSVGGENDAPSRQLARYIKETAERYVPNMEVRLVYRRDRYSRGGDHIPFLQQGYPAVRMTELSEDYRHQHQKVRAEGGVQYGDLPEFVDFDYIANVARVNGAALAALASAPAQPTGVEIDGRLSDDTTLRWQPVSAPDLAGYQIVWRDTTAATWTQSRFVGPVTGYTVSGLSKDNYFFGVQAVDKAGHTSPVSFPKPANLRTR